MDIISFNEAATANGRIEIINANPDSTSGIVTVPKTIASGENVTVPAGRVAVLPNVQVEGTLNVEGEVFIPSGATLSRVVETEGDQTISDVKTFLESPIIPTATEGNQAVNLETANSYDLGVGQTWQNVTASRSIGVTYTNNTGKPIFVELIGGGNYEQYLVVDEVQIGYSSSSAAVDSPISAIVPSGSTYKFVSNGGGAIWVWSELR